MSPALVAYHDRLAVYRKYLTGAMNGGEFSILIKHYRDLDRASAWREAFPHVNIVEIGTTPKAEEEFGLEKLHRGDVIRLLEITADRAKGAFDLIIDAGTYDTQAGVDEFRALFETCLKPGGLYAFENLEYSFLENHPEGHMFEKNTRETYGRPEFTEDAFRFRSHDWGYFGFLKQLMDECYVYAAILGSSAHQTQRRSSPIAAIHVHPLVSLVQKRI